MYVIESVAGAPCLRRAKKNAARLLIPGEEGEKGREERKERRREGDRGGVGYRILVSHTGSSG